MKDIFNRKRLLLFIKGMAMGAADTVPGISGGTIAFVTNIYKELIFAIQSCNAHAVQLLIREGFQAAWKYINGSFLLTLILGIVTAAVTLANFVGYLLENYEISVMAFFIGLILASSLFLRKQVSRWDWRNMLLLLLGGGFAVLLNFIPGREGNGGLLFIFFSAAVAICAMILPGISGAFILVLLGAYEDILTAVRSLDFSVLAVFLAGCIVGLISFSNFLAYMLKHWHEQVLAFLLGVLLGSVYTIWPAGLGSSGISAAGTLVFASLIVIGFTIVYILERLAQPS